MPHPPHVRAACALTALLLRPGACAVPQSSLPLVETFPRVPSPWQPVDWAALASASLSTVFDAIRTGPYLPLLWWDDSDHNVHQTTFGTPSYVGGRTGAGASHESIAGAALVLSAALVGRNVSCLSGGGFTCVDVERMLQSYYDVDYRSGIWTDSFQPNMSFWYAAWASMVPVMVAGASGSGTLLPAVRGAARAWLRVEAALGAPDHLSFNWSGVDFAPDGTPRGVDRGSDYPLPVAAAGVAWLLYTTRAALGEADPDAPALLAGAERALDYLFSVPYNSYWEVLMPYAALLCARINAERGGGGSGRYNTSALLNNVLQDDLPSHYPYRWGWGTIAQRWAGVDVHGLTGSLTDRGGYAFAFDTFATLAALLPAARYEAQFARALGRYAACAANAARLFFPRFNAPAAQSDWPWVVAAGAGADALAYEGLRRWGFNSTDGNITGPYATGDGVSQDGMPTNLAVYGGAYVGLAAALVVPLPPDSPAGVAAFDLLATDWWHVAAAPTTLIYNGGAVAAAVALPLPAADGPFDVYDAVAQAVVARRVSPPSALLPVEPDAAAVFVVFPSNATLTRDVAHNWLLAGGVVIDWQLETRE